MALDPNTLIIPPVTDETVPAIPGDCANDCQCWQLYDRDDGSLLWEESDAKPYLNAFDVENCATGDCGSAFKLACQESGAAGGALASVFIDGDRNLAPCVCDGTCGGAIIRQTICDAGPGDAKYCGPDAFYDPLSESCKPKGNGQCPPGFNLNFSGVGLSICTPLVPPPPPPPPKCFPCQRVNASRKCVDVKCPVCFHCDKTVDTGSGKINCTQDAICIPPCPPPGIIKLVNGVPVCMMDPPTPSYLPSFTPFGSAKPATVGMGRRVGAVTIALSQAKNSFQFSRAALALNPTRRRGIPFVMKSCGCADDEFQEELVA